MDRLMDEWAGGPVSGPVGGAAVKTVGPGDRHTDAQTHRRMSARTHRHTDAHTSRGPFGLRLEFCTLGPQTNGGIASNTVACHTQAQTYMGRAAVCAVHNSSTACGSGFRVEVLGLRV